LVTEPESADLIICSVFGNAHESFRGRIPLVQFIGEPRSPELADGTAYLSFCYGGSNGRNYRLPLWLLQFDWFGKGSAYGNPNQLIPIHSLYRSRSFQDRNHMCVSIFNRDPAGNRMSFLRALSERGLPIHAYGKPFSNWFFGESQKLAVLSMFRFAQCFENSAMPGYHTEKIVHAFFAGCIPVYWGSNTLHLEFNEQAIVLLEPSMSLAQLVNQMLEISADKKKIRGILEQELFKVRPCIDDVLSPVASVLQYCSL
jgi:hypothetical protein